MSKSSRRCSLWVGLLGLAIVALAPEPGRAQENPLFFGVWEPASTSAGGFPLKFEPGRITFWDKDKLVWEEHYEIIKDFGERIVIKIWTVKIRIDYPLNKPELEVYSINRAEYNDGSSDFSLSEHYCTSDKAEEYFFETEDRAEIWRRILAWSARRNEGFPYDDCSLNEDGSFPYIWSGAGFTRPVPTGQ